VPDLNGPKAPPCQGEGRGFESRLPLSTPRLRESKAAHAKRAKTAAQPAGGATGTHGGGADTPATHPGNGGEGRGAGLLGGVGEVARGVGLSEGAGRPVLQRTAGGQLARLVQTERPIDGGPHEPYGLKFAASGHGQMLLIPLESLSHRLMRMAG
jgi:hypothetical protein